MAKMAASRGRHFLLWRFSLVIMSSSSRYVFGICAFDLNIRLECDNEEMRDILDRFMLPPFPRCAFPADAAQIKIYVADKPAGFDILVDQARVSSAETISDAALAAVKALDDALVRKLSSLRAVHAGAVVLNGRALLIPGSTHAGKSSLVAELLRRGAAHLSDEYALIDEFGHVHAYPRPLLLRNGSPKQTLVLPADLNASFMKESVPVGWILAVDYDPEAAWDIRKISLGEAVMLLLRNTPHEMSKSPEMIEFFTRAVSDAACYAGTRGDVADAASRLLDLVSGK